MDKPHLKKLTQRLDSDDRWLLSLAIDEIEVATYWDTRMNILNRMKRLYDKKGAQALVENLHYRLSKPRPEIKAR